MPYANLLIGKKRVEHRVHFRAHGNQLYRLESPVALGHFLNMTWLNLELDWRMSFETSVLGVEMPDGAPRTGQPLALTPAAWRHWLRAHLSSDHGRTFALHSHALVFDYFGQQLFPCRALPSERNSRVRMLTFAYTRRTAGTNEFVRINMREQVQITDRRTFYTGLRARWTAFSPAGFRARLRTRDSTDSSNGISLERSHF